MQSCGKFVAFGNTRVVPLYFLEHGSRLREDAPDMVTKQKLRCVGVRKHGAIISWPSESNRLHVEGINGPLTAEIIQRSGDFCLSIHLSWTSILKYYTGVTNTCMFVAEDS
jgi:hypothetical protein